MIKFRAKEERGGLRSAAALAKPFNPINRKLNRLMILSNAWEKVAGRRAKFWAIDSAGADFISIKAQNSAARHDLQANAGSIIRELNKHFEKGWIRELKIL